MSSSLVYVVDDDESVLRAMSRLIRSAGLETETFPSAYAFLASAPPDRPACLVLDVRMPGLGGLDLQESLRRANRDIPIVFVAGQSDVPMSVRAMKGGAVDFLEKPLMDGELLEAVERALVRARDARDRQAGREEILRRYEELTQRERQVLTLVVQGLLNKQIAARLGTSEKTIKVHRGRVMEKMRAGSLAELVRMTQQEDLGMDC
jgi:RNA polymerase sigma factor (sigma-70 family)